jgi:iron(III) transport system substrate-binding protein
MRTRTFLALSFALSIAVAACSQGAPTGSAPAQGEDMATAANREGRILIYSTTDSASAQPILADFKNAYPSINVEYNDLNSTELYNRFTSEAAAGAETADLLWSSAMDLQVKLAADGQAMTYSSPEAGSLPAGSVWQNQAFGTTLEPFAIAYNRRAVPTDAVPQTHADFTRLLRSQADLFRDKVTTYDPEQSGTGYLAASTDAANDPAFWDLATALGSVGVKLNTSTGTMVERISAGEYSIGYDIIGSYVLARMKTDANVGLVLPKDYTVALSRIALISKDARHPNAAKVFLDYLLSKRGQEVMAQQSLLHAIRTDVQGEATAAALSQELGSALKPIKVGPELQQGLDPAKRMEFFQKWRQSLGSR